MGEVLLSGMGNGRAPNNKADAQTALTYRVSTFSLDPAVQCIIGGRTGSAQAFSNWTGTWGLALNATGLNVLTNTAGESVTRSFAAVPGPLASR